jgi:hypothetical protein
VIAEARENGRPIVPLLGAGISVEAGIPVTAHLNEYLTKLICLINLKFERKEIPFPVQAEGRYITYLNYYGWPERHDVNQELLTYLGIDSDTRARLAEMLAPVKKTVVEQQLETELRRLAKSVPGGDFSVLKRFNRPADANPDWRDLLDHLTGGDPVWVDSLFDRLVKGRKPGTSHDFCAFLAQHLDWRLILTTNFDSLIETALREQGVDPTIYEITTGGPWPARDLVRQNTSILKLHGGAFGLRTGRDLDEPVDESTARIFCDYMPEEALLLVLGYAGTDERVMSLIRAFAAPQRKSGAGPAVLWIHRGHTPRRPVSQLATTLDPQRVELASYHDAGLFLQELHAELTHSHPISPKPYRALPQVPPAVHKGFETSPWTAEEQACSVAVFSMDPEEPDATSYAFTPSTEMASYVRSLREHQLIWIDLEEISSADSFVSALTQEFQRFDPGLTPTLLTQYAVSEKDASGGDAGAGGKVAADRDDADSTDVRIKRLFQAMQRGKYVVALDNVGAFPRPLSGNLSFDDDKEIDRLVLPFKRLRDFILQLARGSAQFPESKLCLALNPWPHHPWQHSTGLDAKNALAREKWAQKVQEIRDDFRSQLERLTIPGPSGTPGIATTRSLKRDSADPQVTPESLAEAAEAPLHPQVSALADAVLKKWNGPREGGEQDPLAPRYWEQFLESLCEILKDRAFRKYGEFLRTAATFRRPRSIVGLACLWPRAKGKVHEASTDDAGSPTHEIEELTALLQYLTKIRVFGRREGGFYWMRRPTRVTVYDFFDPDSRRVPLPRQERAARRMTLVQSHKRVANYYYNNVFQRSRDLTAFFDYLFHSMNALKRNDQKGWDALRCALDRERDYVLGQGHTVTLLHYLGMIRKEMLSKSPNDRSLWARLADLEADVLREATDYHQCMRIRKELIVHHDAVPAHGTSRTEVSDAALKVRIEELQAMDGTDSFEIVRLAARDLLDIGVCTAALGVTSGSISATYCFDMARELVDKFKTSKMEMERDRVAQTLVRRGYRRLNRLLSQVDPWEVSIPASSDSDLLNTGDEIYKEALEALREFQSSRGNHYARYRCYLHTLMARVYSYTGSFSEAYARLEEGRSWVLQTPGGSERTAQGVCDLFLGECLLLDVRHELQGVPPKSEDAGKRARVREKLNRARGTLDSAKAMIIAGRTNVWWLTQTYLMIGELQHQQLVFQMVMPERNRPSSTADVGTRDESSLTSPRSKQLIRDWLQRGLDAISSGRDNIVKDKMREEQLDRLWWRLLFCAGCLSPALRQEAPYESQTDPAGSTVEVILETLDQWHRSVGLDRGWNKRKPEFAKQYEKRSQAAVFEKIRTGKLSGTQIMQAEDDFVRTVEAALEAAREPAAAAPAAPPPAPE